MLKSWFATLNIGRKLLFSFSVVICGIVIFGIYTYVMLGRINENVAEMTDNWLPASIALGQIDARTADYRLKEYKIITANDSSEHKKILGEMQGLLAQIKDAMGKYEPTISSEKERSLYETFKKTWSDYLSASENRFIPLINAGKVEEAHVLLNNLKVQYDNFTADLQEDINFNLKGGESANSAADAEYIQTVITTIALLIVLIIFSIAMTMILTRSITVPLDELMVASEAIAKGNMTVKLPETRTADEIGKLADTFAHMVVSLKTMILKTKDATNQMASASSEIVSASQQQAASAKEQSAAVAETTSAAKELQKTSESVGESIKRVSQVATLAMTGMSKIKESMSKSSELITSLGEKSEKIGKIINLIDDVADQTNLLAVNASIEAARAGEQGRGFTVVADEIRKLADSTAKSTKDIASLIELIQHEMSNAIMSMEQSVKTIEEEAKLAQESADRSKEIAMSANQQIGGSKQISDAMANIDEAMKQIAAGTQQTQAAVAQINHMAKELDEIVAKFKV